MWCFVGKCHTGFALDSCTFVLILVCYCFLFFPELGRLLRGF
ncbi:hypothetical protein HMPREF1576_00926 [Gardnerella pickettii JCP7719]|uniref:Uncharacterized protein n=1 Tax=Gardnerella pickettii JCP7719 TaxID=1261061 RepID=S4GX21_9BIFI|nr:hypothetical protein HMPREF1576_00926 [Gardnerella pickettii JCP7719]